MQSAGVAGSFRFSDERLNHHGAMELTHLIRLAAVLVLLFAGLWGLQAAVLLQAAKRYRMEEATRYLVVVSHTLATEIQTTGQNALTDPILLQKLAKRYGAYRLSILDHEGRLLLDTSDPDRIGSSNPLQGITPREFEQVLEGKNFVRIPDLDSSGAQNLSYFVPLQNPDPSRVGVLRVDLELRSLEAGGAAATTTLLLKVAGITILVVLAFYSVRMVIRSRRTPAAAGGQSGETAAMIVTFHEVVRQLKEKEQELEQLRTRAEERAAHIESYNENILQSVASGVITFNPEHVITTFNHAAGRILGLSHSRAVGKTCEELFGAQSNIVHLLDQVLTHQATITRQELELTRPNPGPASPQRIWVGISTSLLRDRQNEVIGTTFVFTDLTEIKGLQEQVELKRRLTVLGEMSAGIAHEFRNYMGSVMGFTKLLSKKLPPSDPDTGQEMVASIMRELTAMNQLIEQLLSFGRNDELHLEPVAIDRLIRRLLDQLLIQTKTVKPRLEISIPIGLPEIRMDEVLMRQAIGNLLQNAMDAMPRGGDLGIRAVILDHNTEAGLGTRRHRKELSLEIRDTGVGIPRDKLDKIFLPFFTTKEKGTGMGLALVHKIVLSHGGRIEVNSEEGQGTTFQILLPLTEVA
jgi:PAS domain S-box-containing protein